MDERISTLAFVDENFWASAWRAGSKTHLIWLLRILTLRLYLNLNQLNQPY